MRQAEIRPITSANRPYHPGETPFVVVFSGVPGTSKSAIAYHLAWNHQLGILSNDSVRFEVKEDMRVESLSIQEDLVFESVNQNGALDEYERRIKQRRDTLLSLGHSAIFDGSVDRRWAEVKEDITEHGYTWFMINMELSPKFLEGLYLGTGRAGFMPQLPGYLSDHAKFLDQYSADINLEINDETFLNRLEVADQALTDFKSPIAKIA